MAVLGRTVRFRAAAVAAALLAGGHLAFVLFGGGTDPTKHLETRVAIIVAALSTTAACILAARGSRGATRRGWAFLAATATLWCVSNALAGWAELTTDQTRPVPSPADVPAAFALIIAVLGILSFLESAFTSAGRMRNLLDGLLIASSMVFTAWALVLEGVVDETGGGSARALALVYPVGDIVLLALVVVSLTRIRARRSWVLLAAGLGLLSVSHTAFAYLEVARAYAPGGFESFSWIAGCLLIGLAALAAGEDDFGLGPDEVRTGGPSEILVPLLPVLLAGGVALTRLRSGALPSFLLVNGAVIAVLLVARQLVAQLEFLGLNRVLELRIDERTAELRRQEQQLRSLVQNSSDVVSVVDANGLIRYQSASSERVLGYRFGELVGTSFAELFHPEVRADALARLQSAPAPPNPPATIEALLRKKDGSWSLTETSVSNLLHQDVRGLLLTTRDISGRRALENQLRHQALHDPLTNLANRGLFTDRLEHAVERAARNPAMLAVLLIDLDGFKQVNDSLGHSAGDTLLTEVAKRLLDSVRPGDTVARMGGDEFAILLERAVEEAPEIVAQRILNRLRASVPVDGKPLVVQGSIGIAVGSSLAFSAEELLRNADIAMYQAKAKGKGAYQVFVPEMHSQAVQRVEIETQLRRAIQQNELVLHYQPIVELPNGRISGAEALVRWNHPERGLVGPGEFVAIAEESNLVISLGRWVLVEACRQARVFQANYVTDPPFFITVNVSSRQLLHPHLVEEVQKALGDTGIDPTTVVLEITEGALMHEGGPIMATLNALKQLGIRLAIDDFGTGWSSLSRLRSFPVDKLKIDRSFISEVTRPDDEAPIVAAIVAMAHSLHLSTVAEGVETVEQLACLHDHGCEEIQGWLFSKAIPPEEFIALLADHEQKLAGLMSSSAQT